MRDLTVADINLAFLQQQPIEVWQGGKRLGAGMIVKHTKEDIVLDDGMHYLKSNCEFRLRA